MDTKLLWWGLGAVGVSFIIFIGLIGLIVNNQNFGANLTADAVIYVDVPGRIVIDGSLQAEGPAAIPVSAGQHIVSFVDYNQQNPVELTLAKNQFYYLANPLQPSLRVSPTYALVLATAFPPDTTMVIPNCTPVDVAHPQQCRSQHTLSSELSPGNYTLQFTNPSFPAHEEPFVATTGEVVRKTYSFITTTEQWNEWQKNHSDVLPQPYYHSRAGYGIFVPFQTVGTVFSELFD